MQYYSVMEDVVKFLLKKKRASCTASAPDYKSLLYIL